MKYIKFLTLIAMALGAFLVSGSLKPAKYNNTLGLQIKKFSQVTSAFAATADAANIVRDLYYMIQGDPNGDPEDGIVPMINHLLGKQALGGGLYVNGYTTCSSIPSSGSASLTETDGADTQVFTMTFASPTLTVPAGWTNGGSSYDRRVEVSINVNGGGDNDFMVVEMSCSNDAGYIKMDSQFFSNPDDSIFELYFQKEGTNGGRLEAHHVCTDAGHGCGTKEAMMLAFYTPDGDEFHLEATYGKDDTSDESGRATVHGKKSLDLAEIKYYSPTASWLTDTQDLSAGNGNRAVECVDFSTNPPSDGVGACGTAILSAEDEISSSALGVSDYQINTVFSRALSL